MSFNSNAYHRNRCRRDAARHLAEARDIKARAARGEAYDWELPRIATCAKLAILAARQARTYEALRLLSARK